MTIIKTMGGFLWMKVFALAALYSTHAMLNLVKTKENVSFKDGDALISEIMAGSSLFSCAVIVITEMGDIASNALSQKILQLNNTWGYGSFEISSEEMCNNCTDPDPMADIIASTRKLRKMSWDVLVVVISADHEFIGDFAEYALQGRLFIWPTRLLLCTRIEMLHLQQLITDHWVISMMNTMVLNYDVRGLPKRWNIYSNLPYSLKGQQLVRISSWNMRDKFHRNSTVDFFPEKYTNFYGATVNITALDYSPYWVTVNEATADGNHTLRYEGADGHLIQGIANSLNFKFHNVPTDTWDEVAQLVTQRVSFIASVGHYVLPHRMALYDFSHTFDFDDMSFSCSKPALIPKWQSVYYPFTGDVWLIILLMLLMMPLILIWVNRVSYNGQFQERVSQHLLIEAVFGSFLSQSVWDRLPRAHSMRVSLTTWFVFSFVIAAAYRGNLIASLTLPKYPPRPETLAQLVDTADRILSPSYGADFRDFFLKSDSDVFQKAAQQMEIGPEITEGLYRSITNNEAFVDSRTYIRMQIAKGFTRADGSTPLYVGREGILPGLSAWPIVFDAPFKPQLDKLLTFAVEGGLYKKWIQNELEEARLASQRRQRKYQLEQTKGETALDEKRSFIELTDIGRDDAPSIKALTIVQIQGPFLILAFGLAFATLTFMVEFLSSKKNQMKE